MTSDGIQMASKIVQWSLEVNKRGSELPKGYPLEPKGGPKRNESEPKVCQRVLCPSPGEL